MKIGMMLPAYPWERTLQAARHAEDLGVDRLWTADHFLGTWHPELWRELPRRSSARTQMRSRIHSACAPRSARRPGYRSELV